MWFGVIVACMIETNQCKAFAGPVSPSEESCERVKDMSGVPAILSRLPDNAYIVHHQCYQVPEAS